MQSCINENRKVTKMTDKEQIMIDGVDVLECKHYEYKSLKDCEMRYPESGDCEIGLLNYLFNGNLDIEKYCKDNPHCYFKQLTHKTQECESLKQEIEILQNNFDTATRDCNEEIARLEQECEELKKKLRELELKNVTLQNRYQQLDGATIELNHYRKALAPFQDEYFKGLDTTAIAELAKKSIRLTTENRKLETALDEIEEMLQVIVKSNKVYPLQSNLYKILNIISKAKGEENAR